MDESMGFLAEFIMITKISGRNFKIPQFDQTLSGRDILVGKNGIGKSARLQGIMISLVGYIPSVGKQPNATMGYAVGDKMELELKEESMTINRVFRKKISKKGAISFDSVTEVLPLSEEDGDARIKDHFGLGSETIDIAEFISMTSSIRKNFITTMCSRHIKDESTKAMLGTVCDNMDLWNDDLSDIDNLNAIEEYYKSRVSIKKKDLKSMESHRNQLRSRMTSESSRSKDDIEKELEGVESEIEKLTKESAEIDGKAAIAKSLQSDLEKIDGDIRDINKSLNEVTDPEDVLLKRKIQMYKERENAESNISKHREKIKDLDGQIEKHREEYIHMKSELDLVQDLKKRFSDSYCPFVKKNCPESKSLQDYIKESSSKSEKLSSSIKECEDKGKKAKANKSASEKMIENLESSIKDNDRVIKDIESSIEWHKNKKPGLESELKKKTSDREKTRKKIEEMNIVPIDGITSQIDSLKSRKKTLKDELETAGESQNLIKESEKANLDISNIEEEIEKATEIVGFIKEDVKYSMVKKIHQPLVDEINKILSAFGEEAIVMIERDNKDVFDICLKRNRGAARFEVLNAGHRVLLSTAFIIALQELSNAKCKVILIEATDLDEENFCALLEALDATGENIDNIAIARIEAPKGTTSNNWTVHTLDKS